MQRIGLGRELEANLGREGLGVVPSGQDDLRCFNNAFGREGAKTPALLLDAQYRFLP